MPRLRFINQAALVLLTSLACASLTQAASNFVYVSANGANSGACLRTAPCKTIPYALTQVNARGQVNLLDSLTHAPFTVNKPVAIVASPGAQVVISSPAAGSTGITIDTTDIVVLRGLTVMGHLNGKYGILYKNASRVRIEECLISDFNASNGAGIYVTHAGGDLIVTDTIVRDNYHGIFNDPDGTSHTLVDHCRIERNKNGSGILVGMGDYVTVTNTTVSGSYNGFYSFGVTTITNCVVEGNGNGVAAAQYGTITIGGSTVTLNTTGLRAYTGSYFYTMGNNMVSRNDTDVSGSLKPFSGT